MYLSNNQLVTYPLIRSRSIYMPLQDSSPAPIHGYSYFLAVVASHPKEEPLRVFQKGYRGIPW